MNHQISVTSFTFGNFLEFSVLLGAGLLTAHVTSSIGKIEAIALIGFASLLALPVNSAIHALKNRLENKYGSRKIFTLDTVFMVGVLFGMFALSQLICHEIPTLSNFSMGEAMKTGAISFGILVGSAVTICSVIYVARRILEKNKTPKKNGA